MEEYTIVDIETTGFGRTKEDIIEIGAIKVRDGNIVGQLDLIVKPSKPLTKKIIELTHITEEMVAGGYNPTEAFLMFRNLY